MPPQVLEYIKESQASQAHCYEMNMSYLLYIHDFNHLFSYSFRVLLTVLWYGYFIDLLLDGFKSPASHPGRSTEALPNYGMICLISLGILSHSKFFRKRYIPKLSRFGDVTCGIIAQRCSQLIAHAVLPGSSAEHGYEELHWSNRISGIISCMHNCPPPTAIFDLYLCLSSDSAYTYLYTFFLLLLPEEERNIRPPLLLYVLCGWCKLTFKMLLIC